MADKENLDAVEIVQNPEPSEHEERNKGRIPTPSDLAQAIVADRDFITKISSAIWSNIAQNFSTNSSEVSSQNTAVPEGHAEVINPRVSVDQTGIIEGINQIVNPAVSVDQSVQKNEFLMNILNQKCQLKDLARVFRSIASRMFKKM
jgi:hypothetical protein